MQLDVDFRCSAMLIAAAINERKCQTLGAAVHVIVYTCVLTRIDHCLVNIVSLVVQHMSCFKDQSQVVTSHIPSRYSMQMRLKSTVVSILYNYYSTAKNVH